jgi:hypothetical protein
MKALLLLVTMSFTSAYAGQAFIECKRGDNSFKGYIQYEGTSSSFGSSSSSNEGIIQWYTPHPDGADLGYIITAKKIMKSYPCKRVKEKYKIVETVKVSSKIELFFCGINSSFTILKSAEYLDFGDFPYKDSGDNGFGGCGGGHGGGNDGE